MARNLAFFGDPHGNFQGLDLAVKVAKDKGIESRICLGDIPLHLVADFTKDQASFSSQFREQMANGTPYRTAVEEGLYSDAQLERLANPHKQALESLLRHGTSTYELVKQIDPGLKVVAGNHDIEKPIKEVLAEQFMDNVASVENGLKTVWASGGGSVPVGNVGIKEGFMADDFDNRVYRFKGLEKLLLQPQGSTQEENEIDLLVTHIPPTIAGNHADSYSEHVVEMLVQRDQLNLPLPKTIVHGHHHNSDALIDWQTYKDKHSGQEVEILTLSPGILAREKNSGSHSSFCLTTFDEDTKQLIKVDEYRIYNALSGIKKVVLYGEHLVNNEDKKIEFNLINRTIISEANREMFKKSLDLDRHYELDSKGLITSYENMAPEQLDFTIRQNLTIINRKTEEATRTIKNVLDYVKNEWICGRNPESSFTNQELLEKQIETADLLGKEAAKIFNVDLAEIDCTADERKWYNRILMKTAFGIDLDDLQEATDVKNMTYESIAFNWGMSLQKKVSQELGGRGQSHILKDITEEMWMSVVDEVYLPQNLERKTTLNRSEAIGLYSKGLNQGLLSEEDALDTGAYQKRPGFVGNQKTVTEIEEMFGISKEKAATSLYSNEITELNQEAVPDLQEKINAGLKILTNNSGDYILTQEGAKYLTEERKSELDYVPVTMKDLLDQDKVKLVKMEDDYLINYGEGIVKINPEEEGIDPQDYNTQPLWQFTQQQQTRQREQQTLMNRLAQQGPAQHLREQNNSVNRPNPERLPLPPTRE